MLGGIGKQSGGIRGVRPEEEKGYGGNGLQKKEVATYAIMVWNTRRQIEATVPTLKRYSKFSVCLRRLENEDVATRSVYKDSTRFRWLLNQQIKIIQSIYRIRTAVPWSRNCRCLSTLIIHHHFTLSFQA